MREPTFRQRVTFGLLGVGIMFVGIVVYALERDGISSRVMLTLLVVAASLSIGAIIAIPLNEGLWKAVRRVIGGHRFDEDPDA